MSVANKAIDPQDAEVANLKAREKALVEKADRIKAAPAGTHDENAAARVENHLAGLRAEIRKLNK